MTSRRKTATIFLCSSPLQLIHAHLVRHNYLAPEEADCFLFYEAPISELILVPEMWTSVVELVTSKRKSGTAQQNITANLETISATVDWSRYASVHLVISDLYWLMNNVAVAEISRLCRQSKKCFYFSILDEGAVLYTGAKLGWKRTMRCLARSAYLFWNGLQTVVVRNSNADYRHPACRTVYCLHPSLLKVPSRVQKVPIEPGRMGEIYGQSFGELRFADRSGLYLSQPLYQKLGIKRHIELVRASRDVLARQGIAHFYYKAHHFDSAEWRQALESQIGFLPIPNGQGLPVEVWARCCNADAIFGHFSSALLNLQVYGYRGRVIACGLEQVSRVFVENKQFLEYLYALSRLGTIETLDPFKPRSDVVLVGGVESVTGKVR
jgi:hypothetical protein